MSIENLFVFGNLVGLCLALDEVRRAKAVRAWSQVDLFVLPTDALQIHSIRHRPLMNLSRRLRLIQTWISMGTRRRNLLSQLLRIGDKPEVLLLLVL